MYAKAFMRLYLSHAEIAAQEGRFRSIHVRVFLRAMEDDALCVHLVELIFKIHCSTPRVRFWRLCGVGRENI